MTNFRPVDPSLNPRFAGIRTFMRLPYNKSMENVDVAILGVPFDNAASYRPGARYGPEAIRSASPLVRTYSYQHQIHLFEYVSGIDYGDVPVIPGDIHETYNRIERTLTPLFEAGITPIVMGGDHSITLGELRAANKIHGKLALLQFDSHADVGDVHLGQKYTHGTPFRRAVEEGLIDPDYSIQIGMRGSLDGPEEIEEAKELGFQVITADELFSMELNDLISTIKNRVKDTPVFMTFDIDFIDPAFAPGTGTPEVGGVLSREALQMMRGLTDIHFVGFDLVEVLPLYDKGEITTSLAANLMFEMIALIAVHKRKNV
ncbi:agmatinase [Virgibacillus sp. W0181]|uniref:agmatinase n=1 Tax=Virgibacillus sp. W0181 TaxID=3391581 RepID=UPI003F473FCB